MTTLEDASRCPRCKQLGNERKTTKLEGGQGLMHYFFCENERCPWFDTSWLVQTLADGSIPDRTLDPGPGDFTPFVPSEGMKTLGRRTMEDILKKDLRGTDLDR